MPQVVGIDHIVIRVSDYARSKAFYEPLLRFLGFDRVEEYPEATCWAAAGSLLWITQADAEGRKHKHRTGDVGFHHCGFKLRSRKEVDALQAYLENTGATIVDPAGEYYNDYYAVFFLDPDGIKLEGMKYGERQAQAARKRAAARRARSARAAKSVTKARKQARRR